MLISMNLYLHELFHHLQLYLPESVTKRVYHTVSTLQLGPQCVWLVVFGGKRHVSDKSTASTAIVELGELYSHLNTLANLLRFENWTE